MGASRLCCRGFHSLQTLLLWLQAVENGTLQIVPARFIKTWSMWLENIRDWCISRQLWWGHRIPVWYAFSDEAAADAAPGGRGVDYVVARNEQEALQQAQQRLVSACNIPLSLVAPSCPSALCHSPLFL